MQNGGRDTPPVRADQFGLGVSRFQNNMDAISKAADAFTLDLRP
jgi:hypothetical protein